MIEKLSEPTLQTVRKRERRTLGDVVDEENVVIVSNLPLKHRQN